MHCRGSMLAVQMYTAREFTRTGQGLSESLARIARFGYPAEQFSAVGCMAGAQPEVTAPAARQLLDDLGL